MNRNEALKEALVSQVCAWVTGQSLSLPALSPTPTRVGVSTQVRTSALNVRAVHEDLLRLVHVGWLCLKDHRIGQACP